MSLKRSLLLSLAGVLLLAVVLGGIKFWQIRAMIAQSQAFVLPPETVTAAPVQLLGWEQRVTAVGSLSAVQGVMVAAELPGKVTRIAFRPGERVRAGDLLVSQDSSAEQAQLPGAEAAAELARSNLERARQMLAAEYLAHSEYEAFLTDARRTGAVLENLRAQIAKKEIRAPFAGHLGVRLVNLGQVLREGDPIVSLQQLDPVFVDFRVPQQQLELLRVGQTVRVTSDADPGREFSGTLTTINPDVDPATRNVRIQATIANPDQRLRPGMFVSVAAILAETREVLAIPATAVLHAPYGNAVFVVEDGEEGEGLRLRQQFVRLGEPRGDFVAVESGLRSGEQVVTTGVFKLHHGQAVVIDNTLQPAFQLNPVPDNN